MFSSSIFGWLHQVVGYLLEPVVWGLFILAALAVVEFGSLLAERVVGLNRWRASDNIKLVEQLAIKRIERSDFIARIAPMLGLMGTLIPLGPGLGALGEGDLSVLTVAMSVAFDTTVLGLLVGIAGFVIGRIRRRWYDTLLTEMESQPRKQSPANVSALAGRAITEPEEAIHV